MPLFWGGEEAGMEAPEGKEERPVPGTTAMRFAPAVESIERRVVGFVETAERKVLCVGAREAVEVRETKEEGAAEEGEMGRREASVSAPVSESSPVRTEALVLALLAERRTSCS